MIYFIQQGENGPIKIGRAQNVQKRLMGLQVGSPEPLHIIGTMPGNIEKELLIHDIFIDIRLTGEWFKSDQSLLTFIAQNAPLKPPKKQRAKRLPKGMTTKIVADKKELFDLPIDQALLSQLDKSIMNDEPSLKYSEEMTCARALTIACSILYLLGRHAEEHKNHLWETAFDKVCNTLLQLKPFTSVLDQKYQ